MLDRLKQTIEQQIILLSLCLILSLGINYFTGFSPIMRLNFTMLAYGAAAAVFLLLASGVLKLISALRLTGEEQQKVQTAKDLLNDLGAGIAEGGGEELLLRGFIFALLIRTSVSLAFSINFALTFAAYFDGKKSLSRALTKGLEGSVFALMYLHFQSLFLVSAARLFYETGMRLAAHHLDRSQLIVCWRKLGKSVAGKNKIHLPH